jgi:hypothetical protein
MKKLLVIADVGTSSVDPHNFLNAATGSQQIPPEVTRLAANSWLIDAHKSLSFFASLVLGAQKNGTPLAVLPIDDAELISFPHRS